MLPRADQRTISALAALESHPEFQVVVDYLRRSLQHLYQDSVYTKDEAVNRWTQGAAQAVAELIDMAEKSREILNKSR